MPVMTWCQRPFSERSNWRACASLVGLPRISPFSSTVVSAVITRRSTASGILSVSAALCFAVHSANSSARPGKRAWAASSSTGGIHTVYGNPSSWSTCLLRGEDDANNKGIVFIDLYAPISLHIQCARSEETYQVVVLRASGSLNVHGKECSGHVRG